MKKIFLFSPTGYVGSFLKEELLKNRKVELFGSIRNCKLDEYFGDYDIMIYSASVSNVEVPKLIQDNVLTAISEIDFCKKHNVKRIIYLSTDSIYGELNSDEVTADTVMVNPDFYGITKYLAEKIVIDSGIPYYILRMPGVVGRIWRNTFFYRLIDTACSNKPIRLYNGERKFNNILDIDDLIQFIMLLCETEGTKDEIFTLGNMEKVKLIEIVNTIKEYCHSTSEICIESGNNKRCFTLNVDNAVAYGYSSKSIWNIIDELCNLKKAILNT